MTMNIYLTNLGKYNEGHLVGEWVKLPVSEEELEAVLERIGINEEYEEYFITDYESDVEGVEIGEYSNVTALNELAEELDSMQEWELEEVGAILEAHGGSLEDAIESQQAGKYIYYSGRSIKELAEELADEQIACYTHEGKIPEFFTRYFDYEAFARDLEEDYIETSNGCITRY